MKNNITIRGVTKQMNEDGRVLLPKIFRKELNINTGDNVNVYLTDKCIIIEKGEKNNGEHN